MKTKSPYFHAYSQNFKGAPDGWHTLKKVNFLVGENSTGKSSFQQLFETVSDPGFVFSFEAFGSIDSISSASDIIGRLGDGGHMTMGFASCSKDEGSENGCKFFGRLVTYFHVGDFLTVACVTVATPNHFFTIFRRQTDDRLYVSHSEVSNEELAEDFTILHRKHVDAFSGMDGVAFEGPDFILNDYSNEGWRSVVSIVSRIVNPTDYYNPLSLPREFRAYSYGPSRKAPERLLHGDKSTTFDSSGNHAPFVFKDIAEYIPEFKSRLNSFGRSSGLFEAISIEQIETSVGDKPFIITVEKSGKNFYIDELGYGVSQILPVAIDKLFSTKSTTLLVQQPELHLHPRAQAEFGSYIHDGADEGPNLIIETHSDFIIDRFRVSQALAKNDEKVESQVIFFRHNPETGLNECYEMEIEDDGSFASVHDEYRSFFIDENMRILESL